MNISDVKFDCRHFKGYIPCTPNKKHEVDCRDCKYYDPISKRILIIKLAAIGDVIRTTPMVERFRKEFPGCHITWLTQFPDVLPPENVDDIMTPDAINILKIKNRHFDIALNLDKDEEACILLKNAHAPEKYGFTWEKNHVAPATPNAEHKIITGLFDHISKTNTKSYLEEIFEICHREFNHEEYLLNYDKVLAAQWADTFKTRGGGKIILGLNTGCGARWKTRLWPNEHWLDFLKQLDYERYFPILLGGPQEDDNNKYLSKKSAVWYPGYYPLPEFIAMSAALDAVVSQVSMMMHIAIAHKKPLILFNNIFNKHEFEMYGRGMILEPDTGCDCFYGNTCTRERRCMYDLKPERVIHALEKIMKK